MTDSPKKRALIVRNFKNEGTGERFVKDATPLLDAGTFANYEAAGLVTTPPPATSTAPKSAKPTKDNTKDSTKAKAPGKPKSKPAAAATAIAANATTLGAGIAAPVQAPASSASLPADSAN